MTIMALIIIGIVLVVVIVGAFFLFGNKPDNDDKHKID